MPFVISLITGYSLMVGWTFGILKYRCPNMDGRGWLAAAVWPITFPAVVGQMVWEAAVYSFPKKKITKAIAREALPKTKKTRKKKAIAKKVEGMKALPKRTCDNAGPCEWGCLNCVPEIKC